jgi:putative glutamine amidotransferase
VLPRIGLTASVAPVRPGVRRTFLNEAYLQAIDAAGGVPVVLTPAHAGAGLRALHDLLDGLVLTGGEDVEPARYGEPTAHPTVWTVPERDRLEFQVLEWALAEGRPVLAICRGLQVLNVALGGTLYQDLPSERPEHPAHDQSVAEPAVPRPTPFHRVDVTPGSRLAELVGAATLEVNSLHHQAIRRVAPGLRAVGHAPDGLVEAAEVEGGGPGDLVVGVQWHPEELAGAGDVPSKRLFAGFVEVCARRRREEG